MRVVSIADRAADAQALLAVLNIQVNKNCRALMRLVIHHSERTHSYLIQAMGTFEDDDKKIFTMVEFIHAENMKFIGKGEHYYNNELFGECFASCKVILPS